MGLGGGDDPFDRDLSGVLTWASDLVGVEVASKLLFLVTSIHCVGDPTTSAA